MLARFLETLLTLLLVGLLAAFSVRPSRQHCQMSNAAATRVRAQMVGW